MKQDLTLFELASAFDKIYIENQDDFIQSSSYTLFANRMSEKYILTAKQWDYLLSEFDKKDTILKEPEHETEDLFKLYFKNGSYVEVTTFENEYQRSIKVWDNGFINYEVSKGRNATDQYLFLGDTTESMKICDVKLAIEIYDDFEQHWNYLTK